VPGAFIVVEHVWLAYNPLILRAVWQHMACVLCSCNAVECFCSTSTVTVRTRQHMTTNGSC